MEEKKINNITSAKKLTVEEAEAVKGGMKIVLPEQPNIIKMILQLIFRIKRKK